MLLLASQLPYLLALGFLACRRRKTIATSSSLLLPETTNDPVSEHTQFSSVTSSPHLSTEQTKQPSKCATGVTPPLFSTIDLLFSKLRASNVLDRFVLLLAPVPRQTTTRLPVVQAWHPLLSHSSTLLWPVAPGPAGGGTSEEDPKPRRHAVGPPQLDPKCRLQSGWEETRGLACRNIANTTPSYTAQC